MAIRSDRRLCPPPRREARITPRPAGKRQAMRRSFSPLPKPVLSVAAADPVMVLHHHPAMAMGAIAVVSSGTPVAVHAAETAILVSRPAWTISVVVMVALHARPASPVLKAARWTILGSRTCAAGQGRKRKACCGAYHRDLHVVFLKPEDRTHQRYASETTTIRTGAIPSTHRGDCRTGHSDRQRLPHA